MSTRKEKSIFDPTLFNFDKLITGTFDAIWRTNPQLDRSEIGLYMINHIFDDWFDVYEIYTHNSVEKRDKIYSGHIPNNTFAFELFKNMELMLPVIKRENKIDFLTN